MKKYKRKSQDVTAVQWNKHGDSKLVSKNGEAARWSFTGTKDDKINLCTLCNKHQDQHGYLSTVHGGKIICPGTWIAERLDGVQAYSDDEFKAKYEVGE